MNQTWQIDSPRVIDVGDENERVGKLTVGVVGGRVDVVTHDDSPTARVEVTHVEGAPVQVTWNALTGSLKITHGKEWDKTTDQGVFEMLKRTLEGFGRNKVRVSISVPTGTNSTVSTVSADAVVSGVRNRVKVNTVSGTTTVSDIEGDIDLNSVSGAVEGDDLHGSTKVNTVSGSVTLQSSTLPVVKANTVSGDITLDLLDGHSVIDSNSVSGDITVRAPLAGFDVEGNTATGQVVVDGQRLSHGRNADGWQHGQPGPHGGRGKGGGRLRQGDGALRVKANAVSGSVVILRAEASAAAAGTARDRTPQDAPAGPPPQDAPASSYQPPTDSPPQPPAAPDIEPPAPPTAPPTRPVPSQAPGGTMPMPMQAPDAPPPFDPPQQSPQDQVPEPGAGQAHDDGADGEQR